MTTIAVIEIQPNVINWRNPFCASRKGGTGRGGWVHRSSWQGIAAVAAGYRKGLTALDGLLFCFLVQTSVENGPFTLQGFHFWLLGQLSVWRSGLWSDGSDYWMLGNEWVWSGSWTCKELLKEAVDQVSCANSQQKWKYRWKKVGLV